MTAIERVCDIIQYEMNLAPGRVMLWNQKYFAPNDEGIYVMVKVLSSKPFGSKKSYIQGSELLQEQVLSVLSTLSIDVIGKGSQTRDRAPEVLMALNSTYAQQQMEANAFYIAKLPSAFVSIDQEDGAAIPYRFNITVNLQYTLTKQKAVDYYDTFPIGTVAIDA